MAVTQNKFISPQALKTAYAVTSAANTTMGDSPTNSALLMTAGANGARVTRISAIPRATVSATQLQLYLSKDGGVSKRLLDSELMSAYTMAATTKAPRTVFGYSDLAPLLLEAGDRIYVAAGVLADIVWTAEFGDY